MLDLDHWREIRHALASNKLRTSLTAFGVFWGIFMLMVMLGSGTGLENGVKRDFADRATNTFFVWTRSTTMPYRGMPPGRRFELTNADTKILKQQLKEARVVAPRSQLGGYRGGNNVIRGKNAGAFNVMGDVPEIQVIEAIRMTSGRFVNQLDLEQKRKVAVIGARVVDVLFEEDEEPIGDHIQVNGVYFKVVGTFRATNPDDEGDEQTVYIPFTTFQHAFNYGNEVGWYAITSHDGVPASEVEEKAIAILKRRHGVHPEDDRAIGHYNMEEQYIRVQQLFAGIRTLIWIVGIGTLAAGVIGVSNIMLVIVKERTNEIGVRRAVGATPLSIMGQVVLEAIILTSIAGYVGLIAGMGVMELVSSIMDKAGASNGAFSDPDVSLVAAMQALLILVISGTLAGFVPAQRAVSVRPVEALRAEP